MSGVFRIIQLGPKEIAVKLCFDGNSEISFLLEDKYEMTPFIETIKRGKACSITVRNNNNSMTMSYDNYQFTIRNGMFKYEIKIFDGFISMFEQLKDELMKCD